MRDNKLIGTLAAVTVLGSGLVILAHLSGGFGPGLDPTLPKATGKVLARQALSLLKPGEKLTVITRDTATFKNPASEIQLASFRDELSRAHIKIDSTVTIQVDPLRPMAVPAGDFFQLIKNGGKGSVIVSLMGPPVLSDAQVRQLGEVKPAIVAFCPGAQRDQVDFKSLFAQGLLQVAVISKRNVAANPTRSAGENEAFERQFLAVTSANLAAMSAELSSSP